MTVATSRTTLRRHLFDRIPGLGVSLTADSIQTDGITSLLVFGHSEEGDRVSEGRYIYRPDLTGNDRVKITTTLNGTTGKLSHGGSAYTNTSDLNCELLALHPDELNACIQRALRHIYLETHIALPAFLDADMQTAGVGNWAVGGSAALSKVTAATNVFPGGGTQALFINNGAANDYAESPSIRVPQNTGVFVAVIVRADLGTFSLQLYDVTGAAVFGTAVTYDDEGWARVWRQDTTPSGCEEMTVRLVGVEATADIYVDCVLGPYYRGQRRFLAQSWLDERFKLHGLRPARYARSIAANIDDANSRYFTEDWQRGRDFYLETLHREANPYVIQLQREIGGKDIWIAGERPLSDVDTLTTEAATTFGPLDQVLAYAEKEVAEILVLRQPEESRWKELLARAEKKATLETLARPALPRQRKRIFWSGIPGG